MEIYKNKKIELISVFPYKEDNKWFFRLIYEIEDLTSGEIKDIIIPKCTNPFSENCFSLDYKENRLDLDRPDWFDELDKPVSPAKATSCHLVNEYCRLPVLLAHDDSIKSNQPYYYGETIIRPATKEMTLAEIEKELGYSIKLKEE
jgi:hypothetical protein